MFLIIFILGLCVGSFLNVVICRLPKGERISGRSYCPHCKKVIAWYDLMPVFSFILLQGKCRSCHQKISWQYPLVEIATGSLFLLIFNEFSILNSCPASNLFWCGVQNPFPICYFLLIACFLIIIFVVDLKHYIIPDRIIFPAIIITFFYQVFRILNLEFVSDFGFRISDFKTLLNPFLSAILASTFFLAIVLMSRERWMGWGDVKLAFLLGLILGWPNILTALFFGFLLGGIMGMGLLAFGKKSLKSEVPFGPFLVAGTFVALFWGDLLINWYLGFLI